jgi:hypothetical protein
MVEMDSYCRIVIDNANLFGASWFHKLINEVDCDHS